MPWRSVTSRGKDNVLAFDAFHVLTLGYDFIVSFVTAFSNITKRPLCLVFVAHREGACRAVAASGSKHVSFFQNRGFLLIVTGAKRELLDFSFSKT